MLATAGFCGAGTRSGWAGAGTTVPEANSSRARRLPRATIRHHVPQGLDKQPDVRGVRRVGRGAVGPIFHAEPALTEQLVPFGSKVGVDAGTHVGRPASLVAGTGPARRDGWGRSKPNMRQ